MVDKCLLRGRLVVDEEISLRPVIEGDTTDFYMLFLETRNELSEWVPWTNNCRTESDCKEFIKRASRGHSEGIRLACRIDFKGEFAGTISYNKVNNRLKTVEIGGWLGKKYWGCGVMTRSCRCLIKYAFNELGVTKVQMTAAVTNTRSRAICERLGMRLEGVISNWERVGDRILSHAIYGINNVKDLL